MALSNATVKFKMAKKKPQKPTAQKARPKALPLSKDLLVRMHSLMAKSRVLEERLIKIYKAGDAYFWIGAPGEEAWGVPLGLLTHKGQGPEYDYLHMHYRATPTMVALGMPMIDSIRLIMNRATDTSTGGATRAGPPGARLRLTFIIGTPTSAPSPSIWANPRAASCCWTW